MTDSSGRRRFASGVIPQYAVVAARHVIPLLTLPYLTRVLGAEMYGTVVLLTAASLYFQLFIEFGLNFSAAGRAVHFRHDRSVLAALLVSATLVRLMAFAVSTLLFGAVVTFVPGIREQGFLAWMFFLGACLTAFVPDFIFRGLERMATLSAIVLGSRLVSAAFIFICVRSEEDILWVPATTVIGALVSLCLSFALAVRTVGRRPWFEGWRPLRATLTAALPYLVEGLASTAFGALTVVIMAALGTPTVELAFWGACYSLVAAAQALYGPLVVSLFPRMVGTPDWRLLRRLLIVFVPPVVLTCCILYAVAEWAIAVLLGPEFVPAARVFQSLMPMLAISFPALILGAPVLGALGRPAAVASTTLLSGALFVTGIVILWVVGELSILGVGWLRSSAELVLLASRIRLLQVYVKSTPGSL